MKTCKALSQFSLFALVAVAASVLATPAASAQAIPFYTGSTAEFGFGPAVPPNANEWGGGNFTNNSVIFEVFIDYTETVAAATEPFTLFENGADAVGSGVAIDGDTIVFAAGGSSMGNTAAAIGPHGLTAGQTGVQIVAVLEFNGGTDTNELLSLYVNGSLVATVDNPTGNDWAGVNNSNLGTSDAFNIFEYVPVLNPDGANNQVFAGFYPDPETTLTFAAYELGVGDNTVENILISPGPAILQLVITPNPETAGSYDFTWTGRDGKVYDLVSATDLSIPPSSWAVWQESANILGNTIVEVPGGGDSTRFFAVLEKDPVP